ncbi:MAG: isoprenylcysteine carboxyl methyltransferase family protein [Alphaproteobacteria bacterium]|nr:isoprenylcysteine carboxyl methyltransferase family protein [Alphaproteobacteria bacterium]
MEGLPVSALLFTGLVAFTAVERLVEVRVSLRHAAWAFARGGVEHGRGHYPFMVVLHTALLLGCVAEVWLLDRPFLPWLGLPALVLAVACQGLRWWCITSLGERWNTRVIVVPGLAPIRDAGPYRYLRHPNYVVVVTEGLALPLVHGAWLTALLFTVLNAGLLFVRIRTEEAALASAARTAAATAATSPGGTSSPATASSPGPS